VCLRIIRLTRTGGARSFWIDSRTFQYVPVGFPFVFPKIGAAYAVALMVGGQCLAALMVDHFGLMGMPRDPLTIQRVIGVALVAAGAVVMRV
jgi:Putative inner membrane exporter, YdcZ